MVSSVNLKEIFESFFGVPVSPKWQLVLLICFIFVVCPLISLAQPNTLLTAYVDRTDIRLDDVFTLTIRVDASLGNNRPSLSGLNRNFDQVGGISTRSTYTNNNGTIQSWTEYSMMLRPQETGTFTIPSFTLSNASTDAITINVSDATPAGSSDDKDIFLLSEVSKQQLYVQEQLIYTVKLYYSIGFDPGAQLSTPQVTNAVVQQLGGDDNHQEVVNGIGYSVTERRFVIFPQSSGELIIPPVYFSATVGRRSGVNRLFTNRNIFREVNLSSTEHLINVVARPNSFDGSTWLPASELSLTEEWSNNLNEVVVGDAITRNITLTAKGLSSSLLPEISQSDMSGLRFYPDQPTREDKISDEGILGTTMMSTALVASSAGTYLVPEIRIQWWNTILDMVEEAVLPAHEIKVVAADENNLSLNEFIRSEASNLVGAPSDESTSALPWQLTTAFFALAWAISTALWLNSRQQSALASEPSRLELPGQVLKTPSRLVRPEKLEDLQSRSVDQRANNLSRVESQFKQVVKTGSPRDVHQAFLQWGRIALQKPELKSAQELASFLDDEEITAQLAQLESVLYKDNSYNYSGIELFNCCQNHYKKKNSGRGSSQYKLPPLYPD